MTQSVDSPQQRRRFLASGLSLFGLALSLGSAAVMSGCGDDDKGAGQVETKGNIAETPDAKDSMNAYMDRMKKRGNPAAKKK